ncbi:type VII secretion protein EccE [Actinoplanes sp. NPDC023936]|uniref:type VII secretion protein EccE n=1 Tax=Actinoplanes sp. NPDC023936 TaxID=3154910 RepID=UPI0033D9C420
MSTQAAAVLILLGVVNGDLGVALATAGAAGLLAMTWVRIRERWAFQWLALLARFATRGRTVRLGAPAAILALAAPDTRLIRVSLSGRPAAILADDLGLTMLVELGTLPRLATLETSPPVRLQLVLTGAPAPVARAGPAAVSYRALGRDGPLAQHRAILAIRVPRQGAESDDELRHAVTAATRTMLRKLGASATGPLDETATVRVIADLAGVGPAAVLRETWAGLTAGGLTQAVFRCDPEPGAGLSARLLARLLHLPATATTLALTVEPGPAATLLIRITAPGMPALETTARSLRRLLASERMTAHRYDGDHLPALTATLPLAPCPPALRPGAARALPPEQNDPVLPRLSHGLMLGRNRQGRPVLIRPFRPEPTHLVLVGTGRCAQLIVFRALAVGARVLVSTARPAAWAPLVRGLTGDESLTLHPPGLDAVPAGSQLTPVLLVKDDGPAEPSTARHEAGDPGHDRTGTAAGSSPEFGPLQPWTTTMTVLGHPDVDLAASADLLLLQPLTPEEAAVLGPALALGETAGLLSRMRPGMLAVVTQQAVRWAALTPTSVEKVLIGQPIRSIETQRNMRQIPL